MASQPPANLPLFYNDLVPLSSQAHAGFKARGTDKAPFFAKTHAVPLTVDEFILAQRHYPIVFSSGANPVPLALFGLNEGVNIFTDAEGKLLNPDVYVPAYVRRYPFMLAKLAQEAEELTLCFDPTSDLVGQFDDGNALFDGEKPGEATTAILKFCEDFEMAGQRTQAFMNEIVEAGLLMEGEVSIQPNPNDKPYIYRGFQMIDDKKVTDLRGDQLRKMNQQGMVALTFAHLFSLGHIADMFAKMMAQGRVPAPAPQVQINPVV